MVGKQVITTKVPMRSELIHLCALDNNKLPGDIDPELITLNLMVISTIFFLK